MGCVHHAAWKKISSGSVAKGAALFSWLLQNSLPQGRQSRAPLKAQQSFTLTPVTPVPTCPLQPAPLTETRKQDSKLVTPPTKFPLSLEEELDLILTTHAHAHTLTYVMARSALSPFWHNSGHLTHQGRERPRLVNKKHAGGNPHGELEICREGKSAQKVNFTLVEVNYWYKVTKGKKNRSNDPNMYYSKCKKYWHVLKSIFNNNNKKKYWYCMMLCLLKLLNWR